MSHTRKPPTGFVATCQCGVVTGALDYQRTDKANAGKIMARWLHQGCTVTPRFENTWQATIGACQCTDTKSASDRPILPKVVAAAITGVDGNVYSLPPPARHHDVGQHMIELGHPQPYPGGGHQGFLLDDGEFVGRTDARVCAAENNQLLPTASKGNILFSEDLW